MSALFIAVSAGVESPALSIISAELELERNGIPLEHSLLADYLTNGIPANRIYSERYPQPKSVDRLDQWHLYQVIAKYLGESRGFDALPALVALMDSDLPPALRDDLDLFVVGSWQYYSEEEWDAARDRQIDELKSACAHAAFRLNHFKSIPELRAYWKFQADRNNLSTPRALPQPTPNPQTLRDHVAVADERRQWSSPGVHWPSVKWLEANGPKNIRGLRRIAKDRHETPYVRGEALHWSAKIDREKSYRLIRKYAVGEFRSAYPDDRAELQLRALELLESMFSSRVEEVAQRVFFGDDPAASVAIRILCHRSKNFPFLAANFEAISPERKAYVVLFLSRADNFKSSDVFYKAIRSGELIQAVHGYVGIQRFDLTAELDADTKLAMNRWKSNPEFLVEVLRQRSNIEPPVETCREILDRLGGTDVQTARVYRRLYELLNADLSVVADADQARGFSAEAWDGFMRCVNAYCEQRER